MLRRLWGWYYWRRYGICPVHLVLARAGGGYEPKWICNKCDDENRHKHELRGKGYELYRVALCEKMRAKEATRFTDTHGRQF